MAKIGRLERIFYGHCDVIGQQSNRIRRKKRKIRAITQFKVIQGHSSHRGRYQSKARMRLPVNNNNNNNNNNDTLTSKAP